MASSYPEDPLDQMSEFLKLREFVNLCKQGGSLLMWERSGLHLKWIMLDESCNYLCWTKPQQRGQPESAQDSHSLALDRIRDVLHGTSVDDGILFDGREVPDDTRELTIVLVLEEGHIDVVAPSLMSLFVWYYGLRFILGLSAVIPPEFEALLDEGEDEQSQSSEDVRDNGRRYEHGSSEATESADIDTGNDDIDDDDNDDDDNDIDDEYSTDAGDVHALDSDGYEIIAPQNDAYRSAPSASPSAGGGGGGGRGGGGGEGRNGGPSESEGGDEEDENEALRSAVGEQRQIILNLLQENRVLADVRAQKDKTISTLMNKLRIANLEAKKAESQRGSETKVQQQQQEVIVAEIQDMRDKMSQLEGALRRQHRQLEQMSEVIKVKDETIRELSRLLRQAGSLNAVQ